MKNIFRLYITGRTPNSLRAIDNLTRICEENLRGEYEIKIIDLLQDHHMVEEDHIIGTPTVVKVSPPPIRKIMGDLSQADKVLSGLGL